jgi:hypothetical protein
MEKALHSIRTRSFKMKKMLFVLMGLTSTLAFADKQSMSLHFRYKDTHLEVPVRAPSFTEAIEPAAEKCFKFYTGQFKLSRSEKEDLVDICANPRRK